LGYQTPAAIYEEDSSRQMAEVDTSSPAGENSSRAHGRQATIIRPHNGEFGEQSTSVTIREANITQKT